MPSETLLDDDDDAAVRRHPPDIAPRRERLGDPRRVLTADLSGMPGRLRRLLLRVLLLACGPLIEVEGAARLRALPRGALFVFNHGSSFEAVAVPVALMFLSGRPLHLLADWMFLHVPGLGALLRIAEVIPVYGKRARWGLFEKDRRAGQSAGARRQVVDACLARLAAGASVGLFPEGTRNRDVQRLLPARRGLGEIALRSAAPVVPVGIRYPAAARLGRPPRIGRLIVAVGPPVDLAAERAVARLLDREAESCADIGRSPVRQPGRRALARRAAARIMARLAALAGKAAPGELQTVQTAPPRGELTRPRAAA